MSVSLNLIVIRASDLEQAQRFYEALGLTFMREQHGRGPEHLVAGLGDVVFEIYPRGSGSSTIGVRLGFKVASVEAAVLTAQQLGAHVVLPPTNGPWGLRAVILDPEGHRLE